MKIVWVKIKDWEDEDCDEEELYYGPKAVEAGIKWMIENLYLLDYNEDKPECKAELSNLTNPTIQQVQEVLEKYFPESETEGREGWEFQRLRVIKAE